MNDIMQGVILIGGLFLALGLGVWVGYSLVICGLLALLLYTNTPTGFIFADKSWTASTSWALTALPLFIWMGEILNKTRLASSMFRGLAPWVRFLPGGLVHINVLASGIFAAVSGSSSATTATIGRISLPELKSRGYDNRITVGSLCGSGTLGLLIPPSIIMIVYGVAAHVSIIKLFIAGIIPGLIVMALFSGYIALWSIFHPQSVPAKEPKIPFKSKLSELRLLGPIAILIFLVIGSIYFGFATATEAATLGVVGSLLISVFSKNLTFKNFWESVMGATLISCMIFFILVGASFLSSAMAFTGLPSNITSLITSIGLNTYGLITVLTVLFIIMGCFLDGVSIVLLTTSILLPAVIDANINTLWFGIYLVLVIEIAQITPPIGFNLFILKGITDYNLISIIKWSIPFLILLIIATALITVFPDIVTFLPEKI